MYMFVNIRGRALHFAILGLFCLSVFAYYYTATNEIHQMTVLITSSQSSGIMVRSILNASGESQGALSAKNATVEPPSLNASSHDASNYQQMTTPSSLVSSQSTMILNISKSIEQAPIKKPAKSQNISESATPVIRNDSAAAIYQPGHSVSIPEKCPNLGANMEVVILVMSAPTHFAARTAIRQTWGHFGQRKDVGIMFMLGDTTDKQIRAVLSREEDMYRDVIRGNFIDSYSNLTLKTISALEWVQEYCSKVKFFLKTDDDMFINVPRLLSFVNKHSKSRNVIFGRLARRWKPIRNKKSKYYVSHSRYKAERFPDFTTGPAYLLSSDVVPKLYVESLKQTYLKLEDVFTTGIVAHKLGIKRYQANEFFNKRIPFNPCNIQHSVSIHMVKYSEQFDLWKKLLDGKSKCK